MFKCAIIVTKIISITHTVPSIYVTLNGSGGTPVVGELYTLSCRVDGDEKLDSTVIYQWLKLEDSDMETQLMTNSEDLSLSSLHLSDTGNYFCRVVIRSRYLDSNITENSNLFSINLQGKFNDVRIRLLNLMLFVHWYTAPSPSSVELISLTDNVLVCSGWPAE